MKRPFCLVLILCLLSIPCFGKTASQRRRARRPVAATTVTVTGCIRQGVECLVLEPISGGRSYSVNRNARLRVGSAYRITGRTSQVGFCMQGMPILSPDRIVPLRLRCPAPR